MDGESKLTSSSSSCDYCNSTNNKYKLNGNTKQHLDCVVRGYFQMILFTGMLYHMQIQVQI